VRSFARFARCTDNVRAIYKAAQQNGTLFAGSGLFGGTTADKLDRCLTDIVADWRRRRPPLMRRLGRTCREILKFFGIRI